jgi:hypothetical protein
VAKQADKGDFIMGGSVVCPQLVVQKPSVSLMPFVDHYWLSLHNQETAHVVLPDGAVDIVIEIRETALSTWVYGTTTQATSISLGHNCHFIGIRFKPGQSRHFLRAAADELTDRGESAEGLLKFSFNHALEAEIDTSVFEAINRSL